MRIRSTLMVGMSCLTLLGLTNEVLAQDKFRAIPDPSKLQWADTGPPLPNTQIAVVDGDPSKAGPFVLRFRCPDNYKIAPHTHPATEAVTVLEGTFHAGMGNTFDSSALTPVSRGGFLVIPGEAAHFGLCKGVTVLEIHGTGPWGTKMLDAK